MMMGCGDAGGAAPYAGPVWQGEGAAAGSTTAITLAWPAHQADDIGFLFVVGQDGTTTVAGWTHVTGSPIAAGGNVRINLLWKRATSGAMPNVTTNDMGDHQAGSIFTVRGCATSGDPWDTIVTSNNGGAAGTSLEFSNMTTTVNNTLILNLWAMSAVNNTPITGFSSPDTLNLVTRFDGATGAGGDSSWGHTSSEKALAGLITGATATANAAGYQALLAIALKA